MRAMLVPRSTGMCFFFFFKKLKFSTSHWGVMITCLTYKHRRWPFYLASIIVAVTGVLMYFVRESHTSVLLERTVAAIRSHRPDLILRTAPIAPRPSVFRPLILLFTNPTVFFSSLANAFGTALLYLFAVAFPLVYARYAWSGQKATLIFLFIVLGLFFSTLTRLHDRHAIRKSHLTNHHLPPKKPLLGVAVGAPALAVGLWWFAWTIPGSHIQTLPWPASALSLVLVGYGMNEYSTTLLRYVLQPYSQNSNNKNNNDDASSVFVALLILRALLGATFPLFTERMLQNLGNNVAGSVLAAVATAFCLLPFVMMRFRDGSRRGMMGVGTSGAVVAGDTSPDCASKVVVVIEEEEKLPLPKPKPKKTVRFWDDEEAVLEETKSGGSGSSSGADASSGFSSAETIVESVSTDRDVSVDDSDDGDDESVNTHVEENEHVRVSVAGTTGGVEEGEVRRVDTVARTIDGAGESVRNQKIEREREKEKGKKESSRINDVSEGYTSFLGLGLDVERVVGFPYI